MPDTVACKLARTLSIGGVFLKLRKWNNKISWLNPCMVYT